MKSVFSVKCYSHILFHSQTSTATNKTSILSKDVWKSTKRANMLPSWCQSSLCCICKCIFVNSPSFKSLTHMYKDVEYSCETHTGGSNRAGPNTVFVIQANTLLPAQCTTYCIKLFHSLLHLSLSINFDSSENTAKNTQIRAKLRGVNQCGRC